MHDLIARPCPQCGEALPLDAHPLRVWCTQACRQRAYVLRKLVRSRSCAACGKSLAGRRSNVRTCDAACRDAARRARSREQDNARARDLHQRKRSESYRAGDELWAACQWCGSLFQLRRQDTACQAPACRRARRALSARVQNGKTRVIAAGFGAAVECFTFAEVYLRDGGRCYLCDLPTLPLTAPRQALAATIDHVVPVEQGGAHTLANVRLTHLVCNSVKRNRTPEQARLLIAAKPRLRVPRVRTPRPVPLGLPLLHHLQELAKVPRERPSGLPLIDSLLPVS